MPIVLGDEPFLAGISDECTYEALFDFLATRKPGKFFALAWNANTHYPYAGEKDYVSRIPLEGPDWLVESERRYFSALSNVDHAIRGATGRLSELGLSQNTLLVVVGDHGEAFWQHRNVGHGGDIFEESVHVLAFYYPPMLPSVRVVRPVSQMDIAPTIASLLGIEGPANWEGTDLTKGSFDRAFYFSSWKGYQLGYREAEKSFILNAGTGHVAIYDLDADPNQTRDISSALPGLEQSSKAIIAQRARTNAYRAD